MDSCPQTVTISRRMGDLYQMMDEVYVTMNDESFSESLITRNALIDTLLTLYDECNNEVLTKDPQINCFVDKYRSTVLRIRNLIVKSVDFEILELIGRGRYAEVSAVKERITCRVYAMKKVKKSDILNMQETIHFENERSIMILANSSEELGRWITKLFYSFHNNYHIYYVMEFHQGGNLANMMHYYKGIVPEPMIKFYGAELIRAIHVVHEVGFIHRDIQPTNVLFSASGHLKLVDFGSSAKMDKCGLVTDKFRIKSPLYTAPEVFKFLEMPSKKSYGSACDWWSLGILLYELITGKVPFAKAEIANLHSPVRKITDKLKYDNLQISPELKSLVHCLLQPVEKRLGYEQLCGKEYFDVPDWEMLHKREPLFEPVADGEGDTSYFKPVENQVATPKAEDYRLQRRFTGRNLPFIGFTYIFDNSSDMAALSRDMYERKYSSADADESFKSAVEGFQSLEEQKRSIGREVTNDFRELRTANVALRLRIEMVEQRNFELTSENKQLKKIQEEILHKNEEREGKESNSLNIKSELNRLKRDGLEREKMISKLKTDLSVARDGGLSQKGGTPSGDKRKIIELNRYIMDLEGKLKANERIPSKCKNVQVELRVASTGNATPNASGNLAKILKEKEALDEEATALRKDLAEQSVELEKIVAENAELALNVKQLQSSKDELSVKVLELEKRVMSAESERERILEVLAQLEEEKSWENDNSTRKRDLLFANECAKKLEMEKKLVEEAAKVAENRAAALEKTLVEFQTENRGQNKQVQELQLLDFEKKLKVKEAEVVKLQVELENSGKKFEYSKKELETCKKTLEANKKVLETKEEELVTFKKELDARKMLLAKAEKELQVSKERLSKDCADFASKFKCLEAQVKILKKAAEDGEEVVTDMKNRIKGLVAQLVVKMSRCANDVREVKELELRMKEAEEGDALEAMEKLLCRNEGVEVLVKSGGSEGFVSEGDEDWKVELEKCKEKIEKLEFQLKIYREERVTYSKTMKDFKTASEEAAVAFEEKAKKMEAEMTNLKEDLSFRDGKLAAAGEEIAKKEAMVDSLKESVAGYKSKLEDSLKQVRKLEKSAAKTEEEMAALKKTLTGLKMKVSESEKKGKENDNREAVLNNEKCHWENQRAKMESEIATLKDVISSLDKEAEKLDEQLQTREEELKMAKCDLVECQVKLREALKEKNGETSMKLFAENKLKVLESEMEREKMHVKRWMEESAATEAEIKELTKKLKYLEEEMLKREEMVLKLEGNVELRKMEVQSMKEERTQILTALYEEKERSKKLREELEETTEDLNSLQQTYNDIQNGFMQLKAYYEMQHMKDNTLLQQHTKLIDFLHGKFNDTNKQKRTLTDRLLFKSGKGGGKENAAGKELERLLYAERSKCKEMSEKLYQAQVELMMLRGERGDENVVPSVIPLPPSPLVLADIVNSPKMHGGRTPGQRIKHNIPHKFDLKVFTKRAGIKCLKCQLPMHVGQRVNQCSECNIWSHVPCSVDIPPTCGLPAGFAKAFVGIKQQQKDNPTNATVRLEGWIKVLREGKSWDRIFARVRGWEIFFYTSPHDPKVKMTVKLAGMKMPSKVDKTTCPELSRTADSDMKFIIRLDDVISNKSLHLMTLSADNKTKWTNEILKILSESGNAPQPLLPPVSPKQHIETQPVCQGTCVFQKVVRVGTILQLTAELCALGTEEGLYSLNTNEKLKKKPVLVKGTVCVTALKALKKLGVALIVCEESGQLMKCDLRAFVCNLEAAECSAPRLNFENASSYVEGGCHLLAVHPSDKIIAVATDESFMLLEWCETGFDVLKLKADFSNVEGMQFTNDSLFYARTGGFYQLHLDHMSTTEILIQMELGNAATNILKISSDIFLACDKIKGTFIDANGQIISSYEPVAWFQTPKNILYNKPFLCVVHANCVTFIYLPSVDYENSVSKRKVVTVAFQFPQAIGIAKHGTRGFFILEGNRIILTDPVSYMRQNPKWSLVSLSTRASSEEDTIHKCLDISQGTNVSISSSILDGSGLELEENENVKKPPPKVHFMHAHLENLK